MVEIARLHRLQTLLLSLVLALAGGPTMATTFYFDSLAGSDGNSGTTTNAPWQTLTKINATTFAPGDQVLLKNGASWVGTVNPKGSGTAANPIILSAYGPATNRPLINGNGNPDALAFTNQQYWEVRNLEVINPSSSAGDRRGIHLAAFNAGQINHLYVSNCLVHAIRGLVDTSNGDTAAKRTGGIIVEVMSDSATATWFNDVAILNCTIQAVTNQGIVACNNESGGSDYPGTTAWNKRQCSNLLIHGNTISDVCKNAMSIRYANNTCLVQSNLIHDTANGTDGNMICSYGCRGTVFQYNEGYHNNGDGLHDGCLYDADLRSPQTVWQYSYSHDNSWGLFAHYASADTAGDLFGNDTHIIVRYNISQNDQGDIFALTGDTGAVASEYIYNNTIYTTNSLSPLFFDDRSGGHTYYVANNIFYNLSATAGYIFHTYNTKTFANNVFYGQHVSGEPADAAKLTGNPLLVAPGSGGGAGGTNNFATLGGYRLQAGSPCIASGLTITTNLTGNVNAGGLDWFGDLVPANTAPDRGAAEYVAGITAPVILTTSVTNLLPNSVTLQLSVNPGNASNVVYLAFGFTTNYTTGTLAQFTPATNTPVAVTTPLVNLLPGTVYHYRYTAGNPAGTNASGDGSFTTLAINPVWQQAALAVPGPSLKLSFTNTPGAYFSVYGTTNLTAAATNWTRLGSMTEVAAGQFQYQAALTSAGASFFQVRCP